MTRFLLGRTLVVSNDREFLEQGHRVLLRLGAGTVSLLPDTPDLVARLRGVPPFTLILHNPAPETHMKAALPRFMRSADVIANLGRPNPEPPRLILIVDKTDPSELAELLTFGYQDVLIKPLNDVLFESRVSTLCEHSQLVSRRLLSFPSSTPQISWNERVLLKEIPQVRDTSIPFKGHGGSASLHFSSGLEHLSAQEIDSSATRHPSNTTNLLPPNANETIKKTASDPKWERAEKKSSAPELQEGLEPAVDVSAGFEDAGMGNAASGSEEVSDKEATVSPQVAAEVDPKLAEMQRRYLFIMFEEAEYE